MRNFRSASIVIAALCAVLAIGCSGSGPKGVAQDFLNDLGALKFDKAMELATDESKPQVSMIQAFVTAGDEDSKKSFAASTKATITRVEEKGDTAVAYYKDSNGEEKSIDLQKVKGVWKVAFKKSM
jgi:hypothetical protein